MTAAGRGTVRYELPTDPDATEIVAARLWTAGALGVWERPATLVAWFPERTVDVPAGGSWTDEPDRDWQADWKATIEPVRAGRFLVIPTWLADEHTAAPGEQTIVLDPGRAFGTGHHATTVGCLALLDGLDLDGAHVADVGCGTGILAIAAARLGADVLAVDIDPEAVEVTADNARANDVAVRTAVGSVDAIPGQVDVVVANLVTDVVAALAVELVATTRRTLVVSGITVERAEVALAPLRRAGLVVDEVREQDGWLALRGHPVPDDARPVGRASRVADDPGDPRG